MEFLKKLFQGKPKGTEREAFRGSAPVQTDADIAATRAHMEEEMSGQRQRREDAAHANAPKEEGKGEGEEEAEAKAPE